VHAAGADDQQPLRAQVDGRRQRRGLPHRTVAEPAAWPRADSCVAGKTKGMADDASRCVASGVDGTATRCERCQGSTGLAAFVEGECSPLV
jgi:hypothetical protein